MFFALIVFVCYDTSPLKNIILQVEWMIAGINRKVVSEESPGSIGRDAG